MKKNFALLLLAIVIFSSCKKHLVDAKNYIPAPGVPPRDAWIAGINKEVAGILEVVYQNDAAYHEVNAAIFSGYYADERVLLKDLLFPENSELYYSENFKKSNAPQGVFKRKFYEAMDKGNYPLLKEALARETSVERTSKPAVIADDIAIATATVLTGETATALYFPYSTNFGTAATDNQNIAKATIVAADRDADSGPGRAPSSCSTGGGICYRTVTVDDNYAAAAPTHIVEIGARPVKIGLGNPSPSPTISITKVFLGWAKLTKQMDALISLTGNGGGSEIKVVRLSGYLKREDQQITSVDGDLMSLDYSRADIRNGKWKRVYTAWDADWSKDDLQQVVAVYEDDTKGTKTLSGSLSTTVTLPGNPSLGKATGDISYKLEVQTQDDIITQRKLIRESFFHDGMNNQGWGFLPDPADFTTAARNWPIYDGGTIWQFTLPWRIS